MIFGKQILEALRESSLSRQSLEQRSIIDAVMFSVWARGFMEVPRPKAAALLLLSMIIRALLALFELPKLIAVRSPELIVSAAVAALLSEAMGGFWPVFFVTAIILLKDSLLLWLRLNLFDLADLFSACGLTHRIIRRHETVGPIKEIHNDKELLCHLFVSRIATIDKAGKAELDAITEVISTQDWEWERVRRQIDGYWREYPDNPSYWQDFRGGKAKAD